MKQEQELRAHTFWIGADRLLINVCKATLCQSYVIIHTYFHYNQTITN